MTVWVNDLTEVGAAVVAALVCAWAARRRPATRRAWAWLAAAAGGVGGRPGRVVVVRAPRGRGAVPISGRRGVLDVRPVGRRRDPPVPLRAPSIVEQVPGPARRADHRRVVAVRQLGHRPRSRCRRRLRDARSPRSSRSPTRRPTSCWPPSCSRRCRSPGAVARRAGPPRQRADLLRRRRQQLRLPVGDGLLRARQRRRRRLGGRVPPDRPGGRCCRRRRTWCPTGMARWPRASSSSRTSRSGSPC